MTLLLVGGAFVTGMYLAWFAWPLPPLWAVRLNTWVKQMIK
jgi:hypothetical protein